MPDSDDPMVKVADALKEIAGDPDWIYPLGIYGLAKTIERAAERIAESLDGLAQAIRDQQ